MKHIILLLALIISSATISHAQYANPSQINSRGSKIIAEGQKLTPQQAAVLFSDFGGANMGEEYLANRKGYRTGVALSVTGASMFAVGSVASLYGFVFCLADAFAGGDMIWPEAIFYTGLGMGAVGSLMTIAGIPTAAVYRRRIKNATKEYNSAGGARPAVTFSPASSGIGIAMNF